VTLGTAFPRPREILTLGIFMPAKLKSRTTIQLSRRCAKGWPSADRQEIEKILQAFTSRPVRLTGLIKTIRR
jgi:hypothetical protein